MILQIEVNIKILLNDAIQSKALKAGSRNALLAKMENEIGDLVLENNYVQTQILSLETSFSNKLMSQQAKSITLLENKGLLNRELEYLPDNATLKHRQEVGQWFTRAELAVLLSYSKMDLYQNLLDSTVPDDPYLRQEIEDYFPPNLVKIFSRQIQRHRLKREIISTQITNDLIGKLGSSFHLRISELTGASTADITRAYIATRDILELDLIHNTIRSLDNRITADKQKLLLNKAAHSAESTIVWLLRNRPQPLDIPVTVRTFQSAVSDLGAVLAKLPPDMVPGINRVHDILPVSSGLSPALTRKLLLVKAIANCCEIVDIAIARKQPLSMVADVYFTAGQELGLDWIRQSIDALPASNDWNQRARFSLGENLRTVHEQIVNSIIGSSSGKSAESKIKSWCLENKHNITIVKQMVDRLGEETRIEFAMLSVLISELSRLVN